MQVYIYINLIYIYIWYFSINIYIDIKTGVEIYNDLNWWYQLIESGYTLTLPSAFSVFFTMLTLAEVFLMRLRIFFVIIRRSLDENGLTEGCAFTLFLFIFGLERAVLGQWCFEILFRRYSQIFAQLKKEKNIQFWEGASSTLNNVLSKQLNVMSINEEALQKTHTDPQILGTRRTSEKLRWFHCQRTMCPHIPRPHNFSVEVDSPTLRITEFKIARISSM